MRWRRGWLVVAVLAAAVVGCGDDDAEVAGDDPGPIHVHGLGLNPADGALFVATHSGLWRVEPEGGPAARVGDTFQDTMGFTVVGEDRFLGSGHPDLRQMEEDDLPPHLGLIESRDAGQSWETVSLRGEADFHVLRAAGDTVYGFDSTKGRLLRSEDAGRSWSELRIPEPLLDLVLTPGDANRVVASGMERIYTSADGGASWAPSDTSPGLLAWPAADCLFRLEATGALERSADGGGTWTPVGRIGGEPAALLAASPRELFVALHDGTILRSDDGGATFVTHSSPVSGA